MLAQFDVTAARSWADTPPNRDLHFKTMKLLQKHEKHLLHCLIVQTVSLLLLLHRYMLHVYLVMAHYLPRATQLPLDVTLAMLSVLLLLLLLVLRLSLVLMSIQLRRLSVLSVA